MKRILGSPAGILPLACCAWMWGTGVARAGGAAAATTTTLTVTSNGGAVSTVAAGSVVTLTAAVTAG